MVVAVDYDIHAYFGGTPQSLDIGNGQQYDIHAETRSTRAVSWRKQTVENPWVEGQYDVQGVRNNVTELVSAWVYGNDASEFRRNLEQLVAFLSSPSWQLLWTIDGMMETWTCTFSDYVVETQREFQYARQGVCKMSISRLPGVSITYADGSQLIDRTPGPGGLTCDFFYDTF